MLRLVLLLLTLFLLLAGTGAVLSQRLAPVASEAPETLFVVEPGDPLARVASRLEARGFIIGGACAHQLSAGFLAMRKQGKLPGPRIAQAYALEYGEAVMEIHEDAIEPGEKVLVVDDLLATGGTAAAGLKLLERLGADVIGCAFIIDLPDLGGRRVLEGLDMPVHCLCSYEGV